MKHSANNDWLDKALSKAFDPEMREPDFQKWLAAHPDAAEKLRESAQKNKNTIRAYSLWRTIMKSRITKLAAAAVIIVTIGLLAYYQTGSIDGAGVAFGSVNDIAKRVPWMHFKGETTSGNFEGWISFKNGIVVQKLQNGDIWFVNNRIHKRYDYIADSNMIRVKAVGPNEDFGSSPVEFCDMIISKVVAAGGQIVSKETTFNGRAAKELSTNVLIQNANVNFTLIVDKEENVPVRAEQKFMLDSVTQQASVNFDYPQTGPGDIYEAGAPKNAVIDTTSDLVKDEYEKHVKSLPSNYRMITKSLNQQNRIEQLFLISNEGENQRSEAHYFWKGIEDNAGSTSDEIFKWVQEHPGDGIGIYICKGYSTFGSSKGQDGKWKVSSNKNSRLNVGDLQDQGWPKRIETERILENEFAQKNKLICYESTWKPQVGQDGTVFSAGRKLSYIDPNHDYMCIRKESFHQDRGGKRDEKNFDPAYVPAKATRIDEVTEMGRTKDGRWYPARIEDRMPKWDDHGNEIETKPVNVKIIYLETGVSFPKETFDPDKLPK
jgi:hypothetical protein